MSYPSTNEAFRLGTAQAMTVASAGGAAASSVIFGSQTYAILMSYPGSLSSTGGCRIKVIDTTGTAATSTTDTLLLAGAMLTVKATPGQRVSAISNDAGTMSLSITELTK
jgi:hypothetical protein